MRPGERIGARFEIERHVASGGMGRVFRARDLHSGQPIAVKMLHGEHGAHAARFGIEGQALGRLSHPGIVGYVAHGHTASGEPYLAMEWLERVPENRQTLELARRWLGPEPDAPP